MPKLALPPFVTEDYAHPITGGGLGPYRYQLLSDPGGLTQFGAFIEELPPGSYSGQRHWHEDHTGAGGNAGGIENWPRLFKNLAPRLKGVKVINASRRTALTMFERRTLEQEISDG